MASNTLYAPTLSSYMPAFLASSNSCRIYFSLSKFNTAADVKSAHISVVKQPSGLSVVETNSGARINNRYRNTGIIVNAEVHAADNDLYYVELFGNELKNNNYDKDSSSGITALGRVGFTAGWIYKIQIRLCGTENYTASSIGLAQWLVDNSNSFSEWSTVTLTKTIDDTRIQISTLDFDSSVINNVNEDKSLYLSTLDLKGKYSCKDTTELLYSYQLKLYGEDYIAADSEEGLLEDSGIKYGNQYEASQNEFGHTFKTELKDEQNYTLVFSYMTTNKYEKQLIIPFDVIVDELPEIDAEVYTIDSFSPYNHHKPETKNFMRVITDLATEEEEGYICLKLHTSSENLYNGVICLRRADSKDNFKTWQDIKLIYIKNQNINDISEVYDFAIESGIWYKYGIQTYSELGRGILKSMSVPVIRNFEHMFLLGENNQQLKIEFNPKINSYKYNVSDGKTDTIGGKYPFITRNGAVRYRTIPLEGLISFNMDENGHFITKDKVYGKEIADLHRAYEQEHGIDFYNYNYEKDFREEVLKFLLDGKPKLFKSPTEGNIILRLMDVSCTPNQQLARMIYTFTANGHEIAENTLENYVKYNFYDPGQYGEDEMSTEVRLGQYCGTIKLGENILAKVKEKYNFKNESLNLQEELVKLSNVRIEIQDGKGVTSNILQKPGYTLVYNNNIPINLFGPNEEYQFDEMIEIAADDNLHIVSAEEINPNTTVTIQMDYLYTVSIGAYTAKPVKSRIIRRNIGQIYDVFEPNTSLYNEIYYKYYIDWDNQYRKLYNLSSISIEAEPGATFSIKTKDNKEANKYIIGANGRVTLGDITTITAIDFIGYTTADGQAEEKAMQIMLDYTYSVISGEYIG